MAPRLVNLLENTLELDRFEQIMLNQKPEVARQELHQSTNVVGVKVQQTDALGKEPIKLDAARRFTQRRCDVFPGVGDVRLTSTRREVRLEI